MTKYHDLLDTTEFVITYKTVICYSFKAVLEIKCIFRADFKDSLTVNCRTTNRRFNLRVSNDSKEMMHVASKHASDFKNFFKKTKLLLRH